MEYIAVKTRPFLPPKDDIFALLDDHLPELVEGDVLLITSKVLAIHQGRCLKVSDVEDRSALIRGESEVSLQSNVHNVWLTIKDDTLIASAGIDESNADGHYILWPEDASGLAKETQLYLKAKHGLTKFGVVVTDSHSLPLRYGVLGISIGSFGVEPLRSYVGQEDIFGRKIKVAQSNVVDSLATGAVLVMGEGAERIPMVIARGAEFLKFTDVPSHHKLLIPREEDIYYPLLKTFYEREEPQS